MSFRVRSLAARGCLVAGVALLTACGRSSPIAPSIAAAAAPESVVSGASGQPVMRPAGGAVVTVSLTGTFNVSNGAGDSLSGTYSGTAVSSGGPEQAFLTLQFTGGSGAYAGASGSADALGNGAFSGEGTFSLSARGDAVLQGGKHAQVTMNLSGTSVASCSNSQIVITQTGGGTVGRAGRSSSVFRHYVTGGAGCSS